MKRKLLTVFLIFSLLSVSGCSFLQGRVNDKSLSEVKENKKLVIGMEYSIPPMGTLDPSTGQAEGFDVDVARELAQRLGVDIEFIHVPWSSSGNIETFNKSKADCIWNAFDITPERENKYALSVPYVNNRKVFLSSTRENITTVDELTGKVVGVGKGSSCEYILNNLDNQAFRNLLAEVVTFDNYEKGMSMLNSGQVHTLLMDEIVAINYVNSDPASLKILQNSNGETAYAAEGQCVVAFRREDLSLRSEVNQILVEMSKDGTLSEISQNWLNEDISVIK